MSHTEAVAARYSSVARAYERFWAPPLLVFAAPLLARMGVEPDSVVVDLGCGTGAVGAVLRQGGARVIGVDLAHGALRRAARAGLDPVAADLVRLPVADATADGAISTFTLQHIERAGRAIAEAGRVLRRGGLLAVATWGPDEDETGGAYDVLDAVFRRRRVPRDPDALQTWHERVQSVRQMRAHLKRGGLEAVDVWAERATFRWTRRAFTGWATTMGPYGRRIALLSPERREALLAELEEGLRSLPRDDFVWRPEVVYTLGRR